MRARAAVAGGAVVVALGVAGVATLGLGGRGGPEPAPGRTGPAATVPVTRGTLAESVTLTGELSYGTAVPLACACAGTVTWLPPVGVTVRRGGALLRADEQPVVLLYGPLPMFRDLADGTTGADVRQLERNLELLGYDGFTVDEDFTAATGDAVERWQDDLGLPATGTVTRDRVVYAAGPVRIADHLVRPGAAATGDLLATTGGRRLVTVAARPAEAGWARTGVAVTLALPDGRTVAGRVAGVGTSAQPAADGDGAAASTVDITVSVADQKALGTLERGPVDVRYVARERPDVLTVPVAALLALAEGGYGLEVVEGGRATVIAVEVGLFADGRVEVAAPGLAEGALVGVPA